LPTWRDFRSLKTEEKTRSVGSPTREASLDLDE
jgi:hypothetical protein